MTVSGRGKLTNANYVGNRHNCWSGFIIDCFVDKWILVCLELCRHGVLSGPWYLWNHAEMRFASHAVALPELCGPLPYVQGSGAFVSFFFFFVSCFISRTITFSAVMARYTSRTFEMQWLTDLQQKLWHME